MHILPMLKHLNLFLKIHCLCQIIRRCALVFYCFTPIISFAVINSRVPNRSTCSCKTKFQFLWCQKTFSYETQYLHFTIPCSSEVKRSENLFLFWTSTHVFGSSNVVKFIVLHTKFDITTSASIVTLVLFSLHIWLSRSIDNEKKRNKITHIWWLSQVFCLEHPFMTLYLWFCCIST